MTGIACQKRDFLPLLDLPDFVLEKTLSYLTFDEIARARPVCHKFDTICKILLNRGFVAAERFHAHCLKSVRAQLPKRESERRAHPMSRHCEILTAIETRLSMLSMTFMRYVDIKACCFIPGKVIDELFRVLRFVKSCPTPPRPHDMLQELRDISSMAMEHFDETVVPRLKQTRVHNANRNLSVAAVSNLGILTHTPVQTISYDKARLDYNRIQNRSKHNKKSLDNLKKMLKQLRLKVKRQGVHLSRQNKRLTEYAQKISDQDTVIAELKKHIQEWDHILGHHKSALLSGIATAVGAPVEETTNNNDEPTNPRISPESPFARTTSAEKHEKTAEKSPVNSTENSVKSISESTEISDLKSVEKCTENTDITIEASVGKSEKIDGKHAKVDEKLEKVAGKSDEISANEPQESEQHKDCNCYTSVAERSQEIPACEGDWKSDIPIGTKSKRVPTKRKLKVDRIEELPRSRYNPIMDAIRAKRVCLFLEELQS